jgi:ABC-type nitrate/sulfonate/bicarbonate transport system substrate-binding protein
MNFTKLQLFGPLVVAVIVFSLALIPRPVLAQTPPKVTIAYSAVSPIFAGVWMAKEMGAFEKQGL